MYARKFNSFGLFEMCHLYRYDKRKPFKYFFIFIRTDHRSGVFEIALNGYAPWGTIESLGILFDCRKSLFSNESIIMQDCIN